MSTRTDGDFVVLMGVDGSGKSTVTETLRKRCEEDGVKFVRLHWRPYLLPSPRRFYGGTPSYDESNPHAEKEHGVVVSLILLLYYFLDFWLGYAFVIRTHKKQGAFVLFERYYYDLLCDPKRYRLRSMSLSRWLAEFVPRPDVLMILHAEPAVIHTRKPELLTSEIDRQQQQLKCHLQRKQWARWLDVGALSPTEVADAILRWAEV